jgi:hypothetical protein
MKVKVSFDVKRDLVLVMFGTRFIDGMPEGEAITSFFRMDRLENETEHAYEQRARMHAKALLVDALAAVDAPFLVR